MRAIKKVKAGEIAPHVIPTAKHVTNYYKDGLFEEKKKNWKQKLNTCLT